MIGPTVAALAIGIAIDIKKTERRWIPAIIGRYDRIGLKEFLDFRSRGKNWIEGISRSPMCRVYVGDESHTFFFRCKFITLILVFTIIGGFV